MVKEIHKKSNLYHMYYNFSDLLKLVLQVVVSHHMHTRNSTWDLSAKATNTWYCQIICLATVSPFFSFSINFFSINSSPMLNQRPTCPKGERKETQGNHVKQSDQRKEQGWTRRLGVVNTRKRKTLRIAQKYSAKCKNKCLREREKVMLRREIQRVLVASTRTVSFIE